MKIRCALLAIALLMGLSGCSRRSSAVVVHRPASVPVEQSESKPTMAAEESFARFNAGRASIALGVVVGTAVLLGIGSKAAYAYSPVFKGAVDSHPERITYWWFNRPAYNAFLKHGPKGLSVFLAHGAKGLSAWKIGGEAGLKVWLDVQKVGKK